jgi:hypothetical protein
MLFRQFVTILPWKNRQALPKSKLREYILWKDIVKFYQKENEKFFFFVEKAVYTKNALSATTTWTAVPMKTPIIL